MNEKNWRLRIGIKIKNKVKIKLEIKIKFDAWIDNSFHSINMNFWCWSEILEQEIFEKVDTNDWKFDYVYLVS